MNAQTTKPNTLMEAIKYFADPETALNFFIQFRWPNGKICCPICGSEHVSFLKNQRRWQCATKHPRRQFSAKVGTVFEDSPMSLEKWLVAVWLEINAKNSISSCELARALGITQKSAWFMLHRVRHALHVGSFDTKMSGTVEADETFIGGLSRNMHKARRVKAITGAGAKGKTAVMGLLERHSGKKHSTVRTTVLDNRQRPLIHDMIHKNVEPGSQVFTDAFPAYNGLDQYFVHQFIDHAEKYVDGVVHTNGLENFWSLFKRCIKGTHVAIEPFHLAAYVDSEAFRFNNRNLDDRNRFLAAMPGTIGKRLTYKALIGDAESEGRKASDKDAGSGGDNPFS
jgi:transposase-like protein